MQHSVLKNVSPTGRSGGVTTRQAELRWEQKQAPQSEVRLAAPFAPHPSLPVTRRLRTLSRQTFLESDASSLDALVAAVSAPHRRCRTRSRLGTMFQYSPLFVCASFFPIAGLPHQNSARGKSHCAHSCSPCVCTRCRCSRRRGHRDFAAPRRFNSPRDPAARCLRTLSRQTPLSKVVRHP